jgi:phosphate transport system substrate-binding protein
MIETKAEAGQVITDGKYPSPPARMLNLVTKGKPSGLVREFLLWIIGDGQKYLVEAGYVPLTPDQVTAAQGKLK